jgi:predicted RNA-binding Zn-ribbon protein involved in translation (DUF1610 family)
MPEPEIARRCTHCGVTLRQTALYCPQCGEAISENQVSEDLSENPSPTVAPASHPQSLTGNVRERVEKIRHVSSVVIDQAAYDPSLRFILVSAALFVFFLVLLILSKMIG